MSIDFEGSQYPKEVILHAGFFYVRYAVSYWDFEEIMAERGVQIDHVTLNRWVVKYSPDIAKAAQTKKQATPISWRMDETDIKVRGKRIYLYRAIHRDGQVLDFIASQRRNTAAARRFFNREIGTYGVPERIAIDQSGVNLAGLESLNAILKVGSSTSFNPNTSTIWLSRTTVSSRKSLGQCWASRLSIQLPQHWLGLKSRT
jgi:putative transposase